MSPQGEQQIGMVWRPWVALRAKRFVVSGGPPLPHPPLPRQKNRRIFIINHHHHAF